VTLSFVSADKASGNRKPFPCESTHEWKRCTEPVRFDKATAGPGKNSKTDFLNLLTLDP